MIKCFKAEVNFYSVNYFMKIKDEYQYNKEKYCQQKKIC